MKFRMWLIQLVKTSDVIDTDGSRVEATDVITGDALRKASVPPYRPLYGILVHALNVLNKQELGEIFGMSFAEAIFDPNYQRTDCP